MLTRLRAECLLQRCILPSIASNFHAAATLLESSADRPAPAAKDDQKPRPTRRPKAPREDSNPAASQRRPRDSRDQRWKPASSGGGGGGYGQQGGQSKGRGPRRPRQEGGETNLLRAVLEGTGSAGIQDLNPVAFNSDLANVAKYLIRPDEVARFHDGRMGQDDKRVLVEKVRTVVQRPPESAARAIETDMKFECDPNYRIEDVLAGPLTVEDKLTPPDHLLDSMKPQLCEMMGLTDAEFDEYKREAVADFNATVAPALEALDPRVQERELEALVQSVPQGHPNYGSIMAKMRALQSNPGWPHDRKVVFVRRLLGNLTGGGRVKKMN